MRGAALALTTVVALGAAACGGTGTPVADVTAAPSPVLPSDTPSAPSTASDPSPLTTEGATEFEPSESGPGTDDPADEPTPDEPTEPTEPTTEPTSEPTTEPTTGQPSEEPPAPAATGDDRIFPGGTTLRAYRDDPTYSWRVNLLDAEGELVPAMRRVSAGLDRNRLEEVVETCESLVSGVSGRRLTRQTRARFAGPDPIGVQQARRLIDLAGQYGCPQ